MQIRTLMIITATGLLFGCVLRGNDVGGIRTFDALSEQYPADASALARQASLELATRYPIARTSVSLNSVPGVFGLTLENELRGQGFAVLSPESGAGLRVGYAVDEIQDEATPTGYLEIRTSDGTRFSLMRPLRGGMMAAPVLPSSGVDSKPAFTSAPLKAPVVPVTTRPVSTASAPAPMTPPASTTPKTQVTTPKGSQNALLPKAVLTVLPYDWRYQIQDADKRSMRVSWPKNVPWKDAIRSMALEAGCDARFDENTRRVTLVAAAPRTSATASSGVTPSAKPAVSALHPASLPETVKAAPVAASTATSPATPAKPVLIPAPGQVSLPSTKTVATPPIVEAALSSPASGAPEKKTSALTPAVSVKPIAATEPGAVLPVTPMTASSGNTPPPATLVESDGSDSVLLNPAKSSQPIEETWSIEPGSLYSQLGKWASRAGYQLVWNAQDDIELAVQSNFRGNFAKAIRDLFDGLHKTGHPLVATLYEANKVIEIRGE